MIRLTPRPVGDAPHDDRAPDTLGGLIQARIDRRLGRRALLARAASLGIAPPVVGVLLHATSDAAFGRPSPLQEAATPAADGEPSATAAGFRRATAPLQPPGEPLPGGALTIGATARPETLHPWLATSQIAVDVLAGVMDGLLRYDAEQRLQPALALGFDVADDGLTYTFALRDGVTFHDGAPFTADDFVASWQTRRSAGFGAADNAGWDKIVAVETPDASTLLVRTSEPFAPFLSTVATAPLGPAGAMADGVAAFRERFDRAPLGTGPFRLVARRVDEAIVLERFADYWGEPPRLDRIEFRFVPDVAAQLAGLGDGTIGLVGGAAAIPLDRLDEARAVPDTVVVEHGTQNWQHLDLKQIGFLRETRVRQALDFATPRQRIIEEVLDGRAIPAFADQAPGSWAYNPALEPRPFLPERAAKLLDQAGLRLGRDGVRERDGEPFLIELWAVAGEPLAERIVDLIAASWGEIGVGVVPRFGDAATLWGPMGYQFSDRMSAALYTWTNANDPDDMFYWHSSQIPLSPTAPGGNLPAFFYPYRFQEVIDALTDEAATTIDRDERRDRYWRIQELLLREVPAIFLYWERAYASARSDLGGFWPSAFTPLLWNAETWYLAGASPANPAGTPVPRPTTDPAEDDAA